MLDESFMNKSASYIELYKEFLLPVLLCDDSLQVKWGNDQAHYYYRHLLRPGGFLSALEEFNMDDLREKIERNGSCVLKEVLPLNGLRFYFTPIQKRGGGYVVMLLGSGDFPTDMGRAYPGKTSNALASSIRKGAEEIFKATDEAHLTGVIHNDVYWLCPYLNRINVNTYRFLRMASNVTEYALLQSGRLAPDTLRLQGDPSALNPTALDIGEWFEDISPNIIKLGEEMDIPVTINLPEKIPLDAEMVYVDRKRLETAFYNVLNNSFEYMNPHSSGNSVTITLEWQKTVEGYETRIIIEDTGCGISPEELERVFLPYESFSRNGEEPGVGLGLTLAKSLLEIQNGTLSLTSAVNRGTTAVITLFSNLFMKNIPFRQPDPQILSKTPFSQFNISLAGTLHKRYKNRDETLAEQGKGDIT